ncbi:MAG: DUF3256 family protein [Tannerella sp.]|jgi:hypothetical protein|nr:DUF3256 family protein [Tannerella sp.]
MKRVALGLLFICFVVSSGAQRMDELFIKMPSDIIIQLEEAWRKDLVDLYKSGKTATLENTMQGRSGLLKLTDDYLLLQSSEHSVLEMKLLPLVNHTHIICMITTVSAPVADSHVCFYTTEWTPIPAEEIYTPVTADWFRKEEADRSSVAYHDAEALLDIFLVKYSLNENDFSLTAEYTTPLYLDDDSRGKIASLLKDTPRKYEWKSGRFE